MRISSEQIRAILVEHGFEDKGDVLVKSGATEFVVTINADHIDLSFSSGPSNGSYALDVYSPSFPQVLDQFYADARAKTRVAMQNWRL